MFSHVTGVAYSRCICISCDLLIGRLRWSFVDSAAHAISPAVLGRYASVIGISSPRPEGLILGITRLQRRRWWRRWTIVDVRGPLVVRRNRPEHRSAVGIVGDTLAKAHGAAAHTRRVVSLERLLLRFAEHLFFANGRQPVRR